MHEALVGSRCYINGEVAINGHSDEELFGLHIGKPNDNNLLFKINPDVLSVGSKLSKPIEEHMPKQDKRYNAVMNISSATNTLLELCDGETNLEISTLAENISNYNRIRNRGQEQKVDKCVERSIKRTTLYQ